MIEIDEEGLRKRLTDEWLETLRLAVGHIGWEGDLTEYLYFADWCHRMARKELDPGWRLSMTSIGTISEGPPE